MGGFGAAPCPCATHPKLGLDGLPPSSSASLVLQPVPDFAARVCLENPNRRRPTFTVCAKQMRLARSAQGLDFSNLKQRCAPELCTNRAWRRPRAGHDDSHRLRVGADFMGAVQDLDPPDDARVFGHASTVLTRLGGKPLNASPLLKWRRVLLKVSGEALAGDGTENIDPNITMSIAREVASITRLGVEVAIVVGGGNFFRGASWVGRSGLDRASADHIGMMATVMNAIYLQASLENLGVPTRVQTAYRITEIAEPYIRRRAIRHLEKGRVVIFGAGTGNPFFTTDTAAALRAAEISAEVVLKATNVNGVYDCDPKKNAHAKLLDHVSYREVALNNLSVMDITAITLCQENCIPVVVFNMTIEGNIIKALSGDYIGTLIDSKGRTSV